MLHELSRVDVAEFAMVSDRLPCIKVRGSYEPVDDTPRSTEAILEMLASAGGSAHVETLETKPAQWTTRVDGIGSIVVTAAIRAGRAQARFTVERDSAVSSVSPARAPKPAGSDVGSHEAVLEARPAASSTIGAGSLDRLLSAARDAGASDLHLVAERPVLLRIAGDLAKLGLPAARIEHLRKQDNPALIAEVVKELQAKK